MSSWVFLFMCRSPPFTTHYRIKGVLDETFSEKYSELGFKLFPYLFKLRTIGASLQIELFQTLALGHIFIKAHLTDCDGFGHQFFQPFEKLAHQDLVGDDFFGIRCICEGVAVHFRLIIEGKVVPGSTVLADVTISVTLPKVLLRAAALPVILAAATDTVCFRCDIGIDFLGNRNQGNFVRIIGITHWQVKLF
nr:MAG TPA: hypothetical protein [Caudoviricetes sp.]